MGITHEERINIIASLSARLPTAAAVLADALDDMLDQAQERYGSRDWDWTILDIIGGGSHANVSYPQWTAKFTRIQLSAAALKWADKGDLHCALWELAHEAIHLLSPTVRCGASVLEEGLACIFQHDYMCGYPEYRVPRQGMASYAAAEALASRLLALDVDIIKHIRQSQPTISEINAGTLCAACPELPSDVADALAARFWRDDIFVAGECPEEAIDFTEVTPLTRTTEVDGVGTVLAVKLVDVSDGEWTAEKRTEGADTDDCY